MRTETVETFSSHANPGAQTATSRWIPFGLFLVAAIAVTGFYQRIKQTEPIQPTAAQVEQKSASNMQGRAAPQFDLPTARDKQFSLADYKGKFLLLNFWATWCKPCVEEMPSIERLSAIFEGTDFHVGSISIDEKKSDVVEFLRKHKISFVVGLDPESKIGELYKLTGVPETYLIDRDGTITFHHIGPGEWDRADLVDAFKKLIEKNQT